MTDDECQIIKALLDGTIIHYRTKPLVGNRSSDVSAAVWQLDKKSH